MEVSALEPRTFPYLTTENLLDFSVKLPQNNLSDTNFVAPYKFIGLEALSVESRQLFTLFSDWLITLIEPLLV